VRRGAAITIALMCALGCGHHGRARPRAPTADAGIPTIVDEASCRAVVRHVYELMEADPNVYKSMTHIDEGADAGLQFETEEAVRVCLHETKLEDLVCVMKAVDLGGVRQCEHARTAR
jgi:hypothetical protein